MTVTGAPDVSFRSADRFFIGGDWVSPSSPAQFEVIEPATENPLFRIAEAKAEDMARAVGAARQAFDRGPWPRLSHHERAGYLRSFAAGVRARQDDLARVQTGEMGVLYPVAKIVVSHGAAGFDYYADLADNFVFEEHHRPSDGVGAGLLVREPVGVVGAIVAWNGPMPQISYKVAPALLAGCTVVLKASPESPGEAYVLAEIAEEIGLPPGVLNVVTADREVSELLVRDPRVDKITFTGSTAAGRKIASICGERVARCTLEMGGKSAAIVLDDYDIDLAATVLSRQACSLTGQVCSSLTRVVVGRSRHDELVEALRARFVAVQVGDPFDPATGMGPLATRRQRDRVEGYIAKGVAEGATLATGGRRPAHLDRGFFIEPTIFADVDNASTIAQEEIFGPVTSVIAADSEDQAVEIANGTNYGLASAVFTNDVEHAYRVARQIRAGTVGHNAPRADFGIAFGGFKQSGIGREGGSEGLLPFLETKTILLAGEPTPPKGDA
ncbi:MAG TPA: aldehyde dehydrogenase [Acidimicrobiales bacterium]